MQVVGRVGMVGVIAALALFVGVTTASAGVVQLTNGCLQNGTATTSPAVVQLSLAWGTRKPAMLDHFMTYQSVTYSVNGVSTTTPVGSFTGWGPMTTVNTPGGVAYVRRYTTPVIANLDFGESVTVTFVFNATKVVWDDDKSSFGPGNLFAPVTCTIRVPIDLCVNLVGLQETVPPGMIRDGAGNCFTAP